LEANVSNINLGVEEEDGDLIEEDEVPEAPQASRVRIAFLTEQVSHHPPVSAYYANCPARKIEMLGIDQISARVSGTTVRVGPGELNKGIFVRLTGGHGEGETYQITHPVASVNGILRGSFYVTLGDATIITCTGSKSGQNLRAVIEYKEEVYHGFMDYDTGTDYTLSNSPGSVEPCITLRV
jgi:oxysterol-binding protein-related protein 9/10/11